MREINSFSGDDRWLSNFWPARVAYEGVMYPTVEHAYQAAKFTSSDVRCKISQAASPSIAKRLGRAYPMRSGWDNLKVDIMYDLLKQKFVKGSALAARLLSTGDARLVEGNTWNDTFWGVCRGKGENNLGRLLMQVRADLLKEI